MAGWAFKRWLVELHFTQNTDSLKKRKEILALFSSRVKITSMEISAYIWNLCMMIFGLLGALEYTIRSATTDDVIDRFAFDLFGFALGLMALGTSSACLLSST